MSNSPLIVHTRISPNSSIRTAKIDSIIIHHMASTALTIEACGAEFARPERKASSNYGVGTDGRVALYVEESRRSWCSSNWQADDHSITIEVQNSTKTPNWEVSDKALEALIELCVDICRRNNIPKLNFTGDKSGNLLMHKWFAATACPGPYLGSKFPYIAEQVNTRLSGAVAPETAEKQETKPSTPAGIYRVQVGAYSSKAFADAKLASMKQKGIADAFVVSVEDDLYRLQVGPFATKAEADARMAELKKIGISGYVTTLGGSSEDPAPSTSDTEEVVDVKVSVLKKGAKGEQVKALQALLLGYGYDIGRTGVDGSFGSVTDTAVRKYQSRNGLTTDGSVGPATWRKLLGA